MPADSAAPPLYAASPWAVLLSVHRGCDEEHSGEGLHGEGVGEEKPRGEGGREREERQEETVVARRKEDAMLEEIEFWTFRACDFEAARKPAHVFVP